MSNKDTHFREPIIGITSEGQIFAGNRPTDDDDPTKEFANTKFIPDWMVKKAYAAILKRETEN